jgi:hypothetical protein
MSIKSLLNREPVPWSLQIQGPTLKLQPGRQPEFLQDKGDHFLTLIHQTQVVRLCAVPLQQGELGKMAAASFPLPEALADLKDPRVACGKESLHAQLRGSVQKASTCRDRVNVMLRSRRRDERGGLNFEIVSLSEKMPDGLEQSGPKPEVRFFGG